MALETFKIAIIDTAENSRVLEENYTQFEVPNLIYNTTDVFTPIGASEFNFNLFVKESTDSFYHLFTGSETRYKIQLLDITVALSPVILWEGFLLPDFFNEPYKKEGYFIEFTATDSLARLKNKYLAASYYTSTSNLAVLLAECLKLTGLTYKMYVAPGIENAIESLQLSDSVVHGSTYVDSSGDYQDVYTIIEKILQSVGCDLHQYKETWYVVALNRKADIKLLCEHYNSSGVFVENLIVTRNVIFADLLGEPNLEFVPPFKTLSVKKDVDVSDGILPEDIVNQIPDDLSLGVKYWEAEIEASKFSMSNYAPLDLDFSAVVLPEGNTYPYIVPSNPIKPNSSLVPGYYNLALYGKVTTLAELANNYIQLIDPVYIDTVKENQEFSLKIVIKISGTGGLTAAQMKTKLDAGDYDDAFYFAVTYKEYLNQTTERNLVTNMPEDGKVNDVFNFKFSINEQESTGYYLTAELDLKSIVVFQSGYVNIKLYPPVTTEVSIMYLQVEKLEFKKLTEEADYVSLNRNIDFTTEKEIDLPHFYTRKNYVKNRFSVSDSFVFSKAINTPETYVEIGQLSYTYSNPGTYADEELEIELDVTTASEYYLALIAKTDVYLKRGGVGAYELLEYFLVSEDGGSVFLNQSFNAAFGGTSSYFVQATDVIYVKVAAVNLTIDYPNYLNRFWKLRNETEAATYCETLLKMYHNFYCETKIKLTGDINKLVWPLDLVRVYYQNRSRNFIPLTPSLNVSGGKTNLILQESKTENVTDYE